MGITMSGRAYDDPWLVADTLGDPHRQMYGMHLGIPERPTVIIPAKDGRCRYEFRLFPGEGLPGEQPSEDLLAKLLAPHREFSPRQWSARSSTSSTAWSLTPGVPGTSSWQATPRT